MKTIEAVNLYRILDGAKPTKMNSDDKHKLITNFLSLKKIATDFQEFVDTTRSSIEDEKEINMVCNKEAMKEIEVNIKKMGNEAFNALVDSNPDWTLGQISYIGDILK